MNSKDIPWCFNNAIPYILLLASIGILLLVDVVLIIYGYDKLTIFTNGIVIFTAVLAFLNMLSKDTEVNQGEFRRAMMAGLIAVFFTILAVESANRDSKTYENLVGILAGAVTTFVGIYTGTRLAKKDKKDKKKQKEEEEEEE